MIECVFALRQEVVERANGHLFPKCHRHDAEVSFASSMDRLLSTLRHSLPDVVLLDLAFQRFASWDPLMAVEDVQSKTNGQCGLVVVAEDYDTYTANRILRMGADACIPLQILIDGEHACEAVLAAAQPRSLLYRRTLGAASAGMLELEETQRLLAGIRQAAGIK